MNFFNNVHSNLILYIMGVVFLGLGLALYQGTGSFFIVLGLGIALLSAIRTANQKVL